jgi:pyruvate dehydrogenase E1 component alpha subunit
MRGHYEGDPAKYRELAQLSEWKKKDPIARVVRALKSKKAITDKMIEATEREARDRIEKAAEFALSSPWPAAGEVASQVTA